MKALLIIFIVINSLPIKASNELEDRKISEICINREDFLKCTLLKSKRTDQPRCNFIKRSNCIGVKKTISSIEEGEFKNNKLHGFGVWEFPDAFKHKGQWKNGKLDGFGKKVTKNISLNKKWEYIGDFKAGLKHGFGKEFVSNSYEYIGDFKDDKKNGFGTYKFIEGGTYVGAFEDDAFNGKGTLFYHNGHKYVGFFRNGKKNGYGEYYYNSDKSIIRTDWINGKPVYGRFSFYDDGREGFALMNDRGRIMCFYYSHDFKKEFEYYRLRNQSYCNKVYPLPENSIKRDFSYDIDFGTSVIEEGRSIYR